MNSATSRAWRGVRRLRLHLVLPALLLAVLGTPLTDAGARPAARSHSPRERAADRPQRPRQDLRRGQHPSPRRTTSTSRRSTSSRRTTTSTASRRTTSTSSRRTTSTPRRTTSTSARRTTTSRGPRRNRRPVAGALKPPLQGLVDRQGVPARPWPEPEGPVGAVVVRVPWRDLQDPDKSLRTANPIDRALNALPAGLGLKVRLLAGPDAPPWLLQQAGTVRLDDRQSGAGEVVRWWTQPVKEAYDALLAGLAARYDANPRVLDFTVSRCMTFTAEPLLRPLNRPENVKSLWDAGLTPAADERCQVEALTAHDVLRNTRSSLALNPYQKILSATSSTVDYGFTEQLMARCRSILGSRCVLANNSLRNEDRSPEYDRLYAALRAKGPPIALQTAGSTNFDRCDSLLAVLRQAAALGANSVELPLTYVKLCDPAALAEADRLLEANPTG